SLRAALEGQEHRDRQHGGHEQEREQIEGEHRQIVHGNLLRKGAPCAEARRSFSRCPRLSIHPSVRPAPPTGAWRPDATSYRVVARDSPCARFHAARLRTTAPSRPARSSMQTLTSCVLGRWQPGRGETATL